MARNKSIRDHRFWELAALALVLLAVGLPRALRLGQFVTPDESLWLPRAANYYEALSRGDYAATYQSVHPGVTVMWAGAAGLALSFPDYLDLNPGQVDPDQYDKIMRSKQAPMPILEVLRNSRLIMVLAHIAILGLGYLYARRLLGTVPALLGFLLIAFDPFHLGLTRLLHLDGLLANFALLSLLAFLVYLAEGRLLDLLVSAVAAGLGVLTKSPGVLLAPVIVALALVELWKSTRTGGLSLKSFWRYAWPVLVWLLTAGMAVIIFWPVMWVAPLQTLVQVFGAAQEFAETGHASAIFFNGQVIPDGNLGLPYFYFYPLTYLWRTTPVVLAGLAMAAWGGARRLTPFNRPEVRLAATGMLLLTASFLLGMTVGEKKFDRYLLPAYPAMDLIAGLGWYTLWAFLLQKSDEKKLSRSWRFLPAAAFALLLAVIAFQAASALNTFPYYLSYYNPIMGGSRKAPEVMQIGWGEGIDQAARYLNQKPDAARLKVISGYNTGSLSYFFKGADRAFWFTQDPDPDGWEKFITSDYAVIYVGQWQRQLPKSVIDYVAGLEPEKTIWIDGLEYVRIYKMK